MPRNPRNNPNGSIGTMQCEALDCLTLATSIIYLNISDFEIRPFYVCALCSEKFLPTKERGMQK